jgi:hypothetical protein
MSQDGGIKQNAEFKMSKVNSYTMITFVGIS